MMRLGVLTRVRAAATAALSARGVAVFATAASASTLALGMIGHPEPALCKASTSPVNWYKLRTDLLELIDSDTAQNPGVDGASNGGGGAIGPMLVRLAWHCAGTYDVKSGTGGSDGATMRFKPESEHGGNAGLHHARALLEPLKRAHPNVTYADLYVYAGVLAIEACGGPNVGFRPGRSDAAKPAAPEVDKRFSPDGRLPNADAGDAGKDKTATHIRSIFYRMGFNDQEIVALSGAHALGRCHTDRSGYWGPWTRAETTLSNEYFREMIENTWTDPTGELMMLPSDMALIWDPKFRPFVDKYAADEALFFKDFAKAFKKLLELGVDFK
ncbi:heme peroxidase [Pavlovales sp. CCMP2436]|nr:heme peroxidase [Pavlovales sp. CCMP2436]